MIVIGGGLVGLCAAHYLHKAGVPVTVLERGTVGGGASRYNAGEITSSVSPLPGPGVVREVASTVFRPDAPIHIAPRHAFGGARFFAGFLRRCRALPYAAGLEALAALNARSFALYDDLAAEGIATGMQEGGYLILCDTEESVREAHSHYVGKQHLIVAPPEDPLAGDELRAFEPALSPAVGHGFLRPLERWIEPSSFCDDLAATLRAGGVEIVEDVEVVGVRETADRVKVLTLSGEFEDDGAVVAAGIWSEDICRSTGLRLGMQPGKGYSFTVAADPMPRRLLVFSDHYVAVRPETHRLRIAGTMELDGTRDGLNPKRIEAMVKAVRDFLPGADWDGRADEWVAPRPMTPDGLPLVGRAPGSERLLVATGHNMLGLTLAPATGQLIADLALGRDPGIDTTPFTPDRFS